MATTTNKGQVIDKVLENKELEQIIADKCLGIKQELHGLSLSHAKYILELVAQDLEGLSVIKSLNDLNLVNCKDT